MQGVLLPPGTMSQSSRSCMPQIGSLPALKQELIRLSEVCNV